MNEAQLTLPPGGSLPLPSHLRETLADRVRRFGENDVMRRCGVSRIALARALGGLGVRRGTIALISAGVQSW